MTCALNPLILDEIGFCWLGRTGKHWRSAAFLFTNILNIQYCTGCGDHANHGWAHKSEWMTALHTLYYRPTDRPTEWHQLEQPNGPDQFEHWLARASTCQQLRLARMAVHSGHHITHTKLSNWFFISLKSQGCSAVGLGFTCLPACWWWDAMNFDSRLMLQFLVCRDRQGL